MNALQISFDHLSNINFAAYQNHVSVLRRLSISNGGPEDLENLKVIITPDSDFAYTLEKSIDIIKAGETFEFPFIEIKLNAAYLANLTESVRGNIHLNILENNINLFEQDYPLRILTYDQWTGANHLPELLSAFITPNHAQISQVIHSAAALLQKWTGNPSFDEYQSHNPDRVKKQMAAIYEAIAKMNLLYASVPASFELGGQRVRLADNIFKDKIANCLDISLFYASCLEAIGLHPILIIIKGHSIFSK